MHLSVVPGLGHALARAIFTLDRDMSTRCRDVPFALDRDISPWGERAFDRDRQAGRERTAPPGTRFHAYVPVYGLGFL